MTSNFRRIALALGLLLTARAAVADSDTGGWLNLEVSKAISEDWSAAANLQPRFDDDFGELERLVVRPVLSRGIGSGRHLAFGYDAHLIQQPRDRLEHRVWQQFQQGWSAGRFLYDFRLRLEERFIEDIGGIAVRPRFLFSVRYPLEQGGVYLAVRDEVFVGINSLSVGPRDGYDQNRLFVGAGGRLSERLNTEIGYQMQHINRRARTDLTVHQLFFALSYALD